MPLTPEAVEGEMQDWIKSALRALDFAESDSLRLLQLQHAIFGEKQDVGLTEGVSVAIGQMREQVALLAEIVEGLSNRTMDDSCRRRLGKRLSTAVSPVRLEAIHRVVATLPAQAEATP